MSIGIFELRCLLTLHKKKKPMTAYAIRVQYKHVSSGDHKYMKALRHLEMFGVVKGEKKGKGIYYQISDPAWKTVVKCYIPIEYVEFIRLCNKVR